MKQNLISLPFFLLQTTVNGVYAFGFLFMLPQLFLNYKLKSVAHLPWYVQSHSKKVFFYFSISFQARFHVQGIQHFH